MPLLPALPSLWSSPGSALTAGTTRGCPSQCLSRNVSLLPAPPRAALRHLLSPPGWSHPAQSPLARNKHGCQRGPELTTGRPHLRWTPLSPPPSPESACQPGKHGRSCCSRARRRPALTGDGGALRGLVRTRGAARAPGGAGAAGGGGAGRSEAVPSPLGQRVGVRQSSAGRGDRGLREPPLPRGHNPSRIHTPACPTAPTNSRPSPPFPSLKWVGVVLGLFLRAIFFSRETWQHCWSLLPAEAPPPQHANACTPAPVCAPADVRACHMHAWYAHRYATCTCVRVRTCTYSKSLLFC